MNYEELYQSLQEEAKKLKDAVNEANKLAKGLSKSMELGELESLKTTLDSFRTISKSVEGASSSAREKANAFDGKAYIESGEYATQLLEECRKLGIDATGEYPVYEMFPFRVKLDAESQEVIIDRKRFGYLRPHSVAQIIKAGQERLNKAPFKAEAFLNELAEAYDIMLLKNKKSEGGDVYLASIYKILTPMARSRKEYDMQSFAFDLARLYASEAVTTTKDGRGYQFGSSRDVSKAIRILDKEGKEQYLATISFYKE